MELPGLEPTSNQPMSIMDISASEPLSPFKFCSECGRPYPPEDLATFGTTVICAECKPRYVQRMREGVAGPTGAVVYGGFWRRFAALLLDGLILAVFTVPLRMAVMMFLPFNNSVANMNPALVMATLAAIGVGFLISTALSCLYQGYFLSQKGATLGKMLLGLKVVTVSGGPITVSRAVGRYFASILSSMILCIGYIMVAFDDQKRALHDHICGTRVIREI